MTVELTKYQLASTDNGWIVKSPAGTLMETDCAGLAISHASLFLRSVNLTRRRIVLSSQKPPKFVWNLLPAGQHFMVDAYTDQFTQSRIHALSQRLTNLGTDDALAQWVMEQKPSPTPRNMRLVLEAIWKMPNRTRQLPKGFCSQIL